MLATAGIDIYAVDSRILYCGFSIQAEKKKHYRCFKKKDSWVPNQNTMQKKMWHISNQMPYIKYSKLYHGFKSVPRKKDTFKNHTLIYFLTHYLRDQRCMAGSLKCSNLEQITLEMGEPELSVITLISQITSDQFET